tara:strand:- start:210 stop:410 length:201 start_codon:yes stop_codon:yes gene_type:complete
MVSTAGTFGREQDLGYQTEGFVRFQGGVSPRSRDVDVFEIVLEVPVYLWAIVGQREEVFWLRGDET